MNKKTGGGVMGAGIMPDDSELAVTHVSKFNIYVLYKNILYFIHLLFIPLIQMLTVIINILVCKCLHHHQF